MGARGGQIMARLDGTSRYLITLVHGTFAKGAAWTLDSSLLCERLKERLGDRASIHRFEWSGRNTHTARLKAGNELAAFLAERTKEAPGARSILITHSHGGNVALYACRQSASSGVDDIVFLATPFLRCRDRTRLSLWAHIGLIVSGVLVGIPIAVMLVSVVRPWVESYRRTHGAQTDPWVDVVLRNWNWPLVVLGALVGYLLLRAYLRHFGKKRIAALAWPREGRINTLNVFYKVDEAKRYLSVLNFGTTQLSRLLWQIIGFSIVAFAAYALASLAAALYYPDLYKTAAFSTPNMWWGEGGGPPQRGAWASLVGLYLFAAVIPPLALAAYVLPLLRGNPLGYGWETPSSTLLVDVDVLSEPDGLASASAETLALEIGGAHEPAGLVHSFVYEDPRVLAKVVDWITRHPEARREGTAQTECEAPA
jgi:hypothetical protein